MNNYKCSICGHTYEPALGDPALNIAPGTSFENLPEKWRCPVCLAHKNTYIQESAGPTPKTIEDILPEERPLPDGKNHPSAYKARFENLSRVTQEITSSLSIGHVLEVIRDQARISVPNSQEACLLIFDSDASHYTRPLHCAVQNDRINCQLCKKGRKTIERIRKQAENGELKDNPNFQKAVHPGSQEKGPREIAFPILDGHKLLGVLDVIAKKESAFSQQDILLLKDLATLASNAIRNAQRHRKMALEKHTADSILGHLKPFVPETVQRIVEKDPFDPSLAKGEVDVSILFLDIAGYSKMSESLSQDNITFIIEKYFSSYLDVIYQWKGDINETAGDGLMVIFQGNTTENAMNACKAALDIREKTREINEELEGRFIPIDVNMGINSGRASVGMTQFHGTAGKRMTFTATGPVTNLAARIASTAINGDILIGPETAKRVGEKISLHDRGAKSFKNVKGKYQVFSLVHGE